MSVTAFGSARVRASQYVVVHQHSDRATVLGGVVIRVRPPTTVGEWCAYYGAEVTDGIAILYKGVYDDYRGSHAFLYAPGTMVEALDWDGGEAECGGGLHFCAHPALTLTYDEQVTRFLACPVALGEMRTPRFDDVHPTKIKARRTCAPMYEVDRDGRPR